VDGVTDRIALVIASSNRAKILEFRALLADVAVDVVGVSDVLHDKLSLVEGRTASRRTRP